MPYPTASPEQVEFFREHGYLVVENAVDPADITDLSEKCQVIIDNKETMAFDWAWDKSQSKDQRDFKILQSSPTLIYGDYFNTAPFRLWAVAFGSALMGQDMEFWYDQFLAKPPEKGAPTLWHQDEGYWGRDLDDKGITCWMPFHDVAIENGCMSFIDGGHKLGVLTHRQPDNVQSDLLFCEPPDETKAVPCPVKLGSVTFHHSKTPHMTTANTTGQWRRILTQHLKSPLAAGEGDHYPCKVYVNQYTGERTVPSVR
jgi:ectoine hydroxylase-related dioxygenase (phytanoyl-CoA dioxygenase family)